MIAHLAPSDTMQDINSFSEKLKEVKFAEFHTLSTKQIDELDNVLNVDIPVSLPWQNHFPSNVVSS